MPNDTILRSRIRAALSTAPVATPDLAEIHRRAAEPNRARTAQPRNRRIAAIALAIALPAVAFAATPHSLIQATLHRLAATYFEPKMASGIARALPTSSTMQRMVRIEKTLRSGNAKSVTYLNGSIVHPVPFSVALAQAEHDFHVVLPQPNSAWAKTPTAMYVGGTLSYGYRLRSGGVLDVSVKRANAQNTKPVGILGAFTAKFSKNGRLLHSTRVNIASFAVADEVITFQSARLSVAQLVAIGKRMNGREIGHSK